MKKSDELRIKTRKLIAKNLIILVVLAVVALVGVFSWLTKSQTAIASGIKASTEVVNGLEYFIVEPSSNDQYASINSWISTYNTNHPNDTKGWHEGELTFDFSDPEFQFMEDLFLCETTSDGKTFNIPKLIQYGNIAYVDTTENFEAATPNDEYMSFDIYFRTESVSGSSPLSVALKSASSIEPNGSIDPNGGEEDMKDAAIGAVRLSIVDPNDTRKLLWIPAPRMWFDGTANQGEGELHTNYTGNNNTYKPGGNVTYAGNDTISLTGDATTEHWYYNSSKQRVNDNGSDIVASTGTGTNEYKLGSDKTLVTLNQNGGDGYYYNHIRVNLWIEGEDAESRLKFVGGKFNMSLIFDGVAANS